MLGKLASAKPTIESTLDLQRWPSLDGAVRRFGHEAPALFTSWLMRHMNVATGRRLTDTQIGDIAELIIANWSHKSMAFIALAIKRGVNGNFGKVTWGDINYSMVAEWMWKLQEEQEEAAFNAHQQRKG